ncbi:MAG: glycosyltransferase family 4 protein [Bacteroidetes bacterium]|nr:glycosyltransferase family 4 protein [Bacteroidota bacterium]
MRIGFDSKRLYSNFTGLGNYSRSLVRNLHQYHPEHEYVLYTPKLIHTPETAYFTDNPAFKTIVAKTPLKAYWRSFSIVDQLKKDGIELYHGLSNEIPGNLIKTHIKSIVTIHDLIFKVLPDTYPFIDRQIYDIKFRKSCLNADRIIAISNSTRSDIIKFYGVDPDKIEVIYQSCHPLFYQTPAITENAHLLQNYDIPTEFLLFVGSVEKRKNLKLILESYQHLKPEFSIPLIVIGKSKGQEKEIQNIIAAQKLEKKVFWISDLKDNYSLQALYQRAMALVYPSFYEGFGLPVAEALLSKTPVITSNVSSLPEAGGPKSFYVNPNSSEELAEAITQVLSDSALRKTMIEQGYAYAMDNFTPDHVTSRIIACYENTIQERK